MKTSKGTFSGLQENNNSFSGNLWKQPAQPAFHSPASLMPRSFAYRWKSFVRIVRVAYEGLNRLLAEYYQLCSRIGIEIPQEKATPSEMSLNLAELVDCNGLKLHTRIEVKQGLVWITGAPDEGDILLRSGQRYALKGNWPFVVQALEPSTIVLSS